MPKGYNLSQAEFIKLRSKLKKEVKNGNPRTIIAECMDAKRIFEEKGYPDCWHDWERAQSDAEFQLQREHRSKG